MSSLDRALEIETHEAMMCRLGLRPEDLPRHEARIVALQKERELLYQQDLLAAAALTGMTAPKKREPSCFRWMGADEYLDSRGEVREQKYDEHHH